MNSTRCSDGIKAASSAYYVTSGYQFSERKAGTTPHKQLYRKLSGEEVSINNQVNPMFLKNVGYNDKVYRNMLIEMNAFIKQQQRQKDL